MISSANRRTLDNAAMLCHTISINDGGTLTTRVKLKETTFILGDKPMKTLLWCDKQKRSKRNKPAKINGIIVTNTVEVFHDL